MPTQQRRHVDALFVCYEEQENLGIRSISASVQASGFRAGIAPFRPEDPSSVIEAVQAHSPNLVGFSVIFQYTLDQFADLMTALRKAGVRAHFTAGGHFPSLRPQEILEALPDLDSVVRFEGELTTVDLLRHLDQPEIWPTIDGLVFRRGSEVIINPPRPLITDLDSLPPPVRSYPFSTSQGIRFASMLASRGCLYNCSFCSIRQFYGGAPGPLRRARAPEAVVAEMRDLYKRFGVRLFLFRDDDFAARSRQQRQWLDEFLRALDEADLTGQVGWSISCRVDDVDQSVIARCRDHGLLTVYLGVETGSPASLRTLNKQVTVDENLSAIDTLKKAGINFEMGFMLFDPDSTIGSIRENINFLRQVTIDGKCTAGFCKMLPYAGTAIEVRLKKEGRLSGTVSRPDYDFVDPRLDWYAFFVVTVFHFRNFDRLGLVERLRVARFDQAVARAFKKGTWVDEYAEDLRRVTARANAVALDTLESALHFVEVRDTDSIVADWSLLAYLNGREQEAETELQQDLDRVLRTYSPKLLSAFAAEFSYRNSNDRREHLMPQFA